MVRTDARKMLRLARTAGQRYAQGAMSDVTRILDALAAGDSHAADDLLPLVYAELRRLAACKLAREKPGQTLDATALVHEAYLRLVGGARPRENRPGGGGGGGRSGGGGYGGGNRRY